MTRGRKWLSSLSKSTGSSWPPRNRLYAWTKTSPSSRLPFASVTETRRRSFSIRYSLIRLVSARTRQFSSASLRLRTGGSCVRRGLRSGRDRTHSRHPRAAGREWFLRRRGVLDRTIASLAARSDGAGRRRSRAHRAARHGGPGEAAVGRAVRRHAGEHRHRRPGGGSALAPLRAALRRLDAAR